MEKLDLLRKRDIGTKEESWGLKKHEKEIIESFIGQKTDFLTFQRISSVDLDLFPQDKNSVNGYVCDINLNNIRRINKFFEGINERVENDGFLLFSFEDKQTRKIRKFGSIPNLLYKLYYPIDFFLHRVLPKLNWTKKVYFSITKGKGRVFSVTEILGRLISCGFEIINYQRYGYTNYIYVQKKELPNKDMSPSYGMFCTLKRVGKDKELIDVYKLRTMHPYSEYLQGYLFEKNGTKDGDKIENDFRVTKWGKIFRSLWIDELPMILNLLKGELKIVGVRPLSRHKFGTYPDWLQEKRTKFKPGLVPPFYADMPNTIDEFYESESIYLDKYEKSPLKTDIIYFFKALNNIFIKKARSK